ncbi:hypothetical protein BJX96DRAFT_150934 [Aspergillus floccosus]
MVAWTTYPTVGAYSASKAEMRCKLNITSLPSLYISLRILDATDLLNQEVSSLGITTPIRTGVLPYRAVEPPEQHVCRDKHPRLQELDGGSIWPVPCDARLAGG